MEYSPVLVWQIILVFAICIFLVILSGKSSLKLLTSSNGFISKRKAPWGLDSAAVLFLLYAILFPAVSLKICNFFIPDLNLDYVSQSLSTSSSVNAGDKSENSEDALNAVPQIDKNAEKPSIATQHPMARLLIRAYESPNFTIVLLIFFVTVVCVAPLTEEFIFRVVIQGAFENKILHNDVREKEPVFSIDSLPPKWKISLVIGTPALIFALLHTGLVESSPTPCNVLFKNTASSLVSNIITLIVGCIVLRRCYEAKNIDPSCDYLTSKNLSVHFIAFRTFLKNFYHGVILYLIAAPIVLGTNLLAQKVFPNMIVAPIPIFLFAIWNGYIYYKTRQYAICVGTHMTLNFTSFVLLFLNVRAHTFGIF